MKNLLSLFMIMFLSAFLFTNCKKKDNGIAPALPPLESLTIDFTNFSSQKKSAAFSFQQKGINNSNWEFAASLADTWRLIITTTLAIPISSFKLAADKDPVSIDDNTWQWSYSVILTDTYKARLTGQINGENVLWKMYVKKEGTGGFAEFVWFEGKSKVDGTSGLWTFNESAAIQQPVIQIDWTKPNETIGTITYTYLKNDTYKGNYIEYGEGTTTNALYNSYYKISFTNIHGTFIANVEWNTSTKNGRVKCPDYLNGSWFCWDTSKTNNEINCPQ